MSSSTRPESPTALLCARCEHPLEAPVLGCLACGVGVHKVCSIPLGGRCPEEECERELVKPETDILHAIKVTPLDLFLILGVPLLVGVAAYFLLPAEWKGVRILSCVYAFPLGTCFAGWLRVPGSLRRYALKGAQWGALAGMAMIVPLGFRALEDVDLDDLHAPSWEAIPFVFGVLAWLAIAGVAWRMFRIAAQVELTGEAKVLEGLG